ncbi:F-box protein [Candidatus Odyssella acanthamoebae]|uniref:F-box domain-containing protein n=1 Tax=Candidatus Odyssella acanthamoebae TaxID=91604 RepID=A0A077ASZ7_9PROT|nr:F-box protein [Candidatus Paracaedibacter acanthamoebae]AIK96327.1 hypothetical protein ID47_05650 [Candidatus Paracaedibacter acanthamoebae]
MNVKKLAMFLLLSSFSNLMAMEMPDIGGKETRKRSLEEIEGDQSQKAEGEPKHKSPRLEETEKSDSLLPALEDKTDTEEDLTMQIPEELWTYIFSHLDERNLRNVQQSSKRFRQIGNEPILWKAVAQRQGLTDVNKLRTIHDLPTYMLYKFGDSVKVDVYCQMLEAYPNSRLIGFDIAYGHHFGAFCEEDVVQFDNFDGIHVMLTTAQGRNLSLKTSTEIIGNSDALYLLIAADRDQRKESERPKTVFSGAILPALVESNAVHGQYMTTEERTNFPTVEDKKTPLISADILASTRSNLMFSWNEFPIQVKFNVLSGHAGLNPPEIFGAIYRDGVLSNLTKWTVSYYRLDQVLEAADIGLNMLFGTDKVQKKTVVLTNYFVDFTEAGETFTYEHPIDQLSDIKVFLEQSKNGNKEALLNKDSYTGEEKDDEDNFSES